MTELAGGIHRYLPPRNLPWAHSFAPQQGLRRGTTPLSHRRGFARLERRASSQLVAAKPAWLQGLSHGRCRATGGETRRLWGWGPHRTPQDSEAGQEPGWSGGGGGQPEAATATGTEKRKPLCVISLYAARSLCSLSGLGPVDPLDRGLGRVRAGLGRAGQDARKPGTAPSVSCSLSSSHTLTSTPLKAHWPPGSSWTRRVCCLRTLVCALALPWSLSTSSRALLRGRLVHRPVVTVLSRGAIALSRAFPASCFGCCIAYLFIFCLRHWNTDARQEQ